MRPGEVDRLAGELRSGDPLRRDVAVARLRVIGGRALAALTSIISSDTDPAARAAAIAALDGVEDPRVIALALGALGDGDGDVAIAALTVLRTWITRERGTRVLEAVTTVALDRGRPAAVRLAALDTLSALPPDLVAPVLEQAPDASGTYADPSAAREWVAANGPTVPLSELHDVLVLCREREHHERSPLRKRDWLTARAAVHAALAQRGSRLGVYDLREAFDAAREPLPLDFLTAVMAIGDASCLEPMARAWEASPNEPWWRERLADAAAGIMHRTRLSGRSAVVKRIRGKCSGFL